MVAQPFNPPNARAILECLIISGKLPLPIVALKHELTHSYHSLVDRSDTELAEVQAYRISSLPIHRAKPYEVADHIRNIKTKDGQEFLYPGVRRSKLNAALRLIDGAIVAGIDIKILAQMIGNYTQWNERQMAYSTLAEKIAAEVRYMRRRTGVVNLSEYIEHKIAEEELVRQIAYEVVFEAVAA